MLSLDTDWDGENVSLKEFPALHVLAPQCFRVVADRAARMFPSLIDLAQVDRVALTSACFVSKHPSRIDARPCCSRNLRTGNEFQPSFARTRSL